MISYKFYFDSVVHLFRKKAPLSECNFCGRPLARDDATGLHYCLGCCSIVTEWLPENLSYMLAGEPGTGKTAWMYVLLDYHLKKYTKCAFIAVDDVPSRIRTAARPCIDALEEHESSARLAIVDGYSPLARAESKERYFVKGTGELVDFERTIVTLLSKQVKVFFLDSATPLFARYDDRAVLTFLTKACGRVKSNGGTIFFSASAELMRTPTTAKLAHCVDALLEYRHSEMRPTTTVGELGLQAWLRGKAPKKSSSLASYIHELRISKMRGNRLYEGWIPFVVGKTGILLALPADREENEKLWQEVNRITERARKLQEMLAKIFTTMGFSVRDIPNAGTHATDLIVEKGSDRILVQGKWINPFEELGVAEVQKTLQSVEFYDANRAIVVTISDFTGAARRQAEKASDKIELWDRKTLRQKLKHSQVEWPSPPIEPLSGLP